MTTGWGNSLLSSLLTPAQFFFAYIPAWMFVRGVNRWICGPVCRTALNGSPAGQDVSAGSKRGAENSLFFSEFALRKSAGCDIIALSIGENLPLVIPHLWAFCAVIIFSQQQGWDISLSPLPPTQSCFFYFLRRNSPRLLKFH
jgi:hypothetical protein